VTGVAAGAHHRGVVHRVCHEARRGIDVAIAALNSSGRNMRWRRKAKRSRPIVASGAIRIAWLVDVGASSPTGESRRRAGMAD